MSGKFDSRKCSQSIKCKQRPQIFVKLSFRALLSDGEVQPENIYSCTPFVLLRTHTFTDESSTALLQLPLCLFRLIMNG